MILAHTNFRPHLGPAHSIVAGGRKLFGGGGSVVRYVAADHQGYCGKATHAIVDHYFAVVEENQKGQQGDWVAVHALVVVVRVLMHYLGFVRASHPCVVVDQRK